MKAKADEGLRRSPRRRTYSFNRIVHAGCFVCGGSQAKWFGGNSQGVAARHFDATGHETWVDLTMSIRYRDASEQPAAQRPPSPPDSPEGLGRSEAQGAVPGESTNPEER